MRILISNDDGIHAPGIRALYRAFKKFGEVEVVAPLEEWSTAGHSLTLHKPLRLVPIEKHFHGCSGSPADSVYLGIRQVFKQMPDLVISGINRGANLGQDVYYSGTVSAAREASILGIPAMAVSLCIDFAHAGADEDRNYAAAAKVAAQVFQKMRSRELPKHTLLNLNVPDLPYSRIRGVRLARQGFRYYSGNVLRRKDHRGRDYFWVGGKYRGFRDEPETDCVAVEAGFASLTPVKLDSTDLPSLVALSEVWPAK